MDRLARLKALVEENPQDRFGRYGLAMELASPGRLEESLGEFRALMSFGSDYVASYLQTGPTLGKLSRIEEAREVYRKGMEVAARKGDMKRAASWSRRSSYSISPNESIPIHSPL